MQIFLQYSFIKYYRVFFQIKDDEFQIDDMKSAILPFIKDEEAKEELGDKLDTCKNESKLIVFINTILIIP